MNCIHTMLLVVVISINSMTFGMDESNPMDALLREFPEYTDTQHAIAKSRQSVDLRTWLKEEEQKTKTKLAQLQQNLDSCDDLAMLQESLTPDTTSPTKKTPKKCILSKPWIVTISCSALILYITYYFGKKYVVKSLKKQSHKANIHHQKIVLD